MFTSIGHLIKTLPRRSKTPDAIIALHIRQAFSEALKNIYKDLEPALFEDIKASIFKNGTLTVIAPPLLSLELSMRSRGLVREINKVLGKNIVLRIRYRNN